MPAESFGQWLKQRRKALDLTQTELAQMVGCSMGTIRKIEADERRPSKATADRLAMCLGVPAHAQPKFVDLARAGIQPGQGQAVRAADVADTTLDWNQMLVGLNALRRGDFAFHLPPQPPGSQAAAVVSAYNALVLQLIKITAELTRVVREVGHDSRLGCQSEVPQLDGRWRDLQEDVNEMAAILTVQVRQLGQTTAALAAGAPAPRLPANGRGEMRGIQEALNQLVDHAIVVKLPGIAS